ncbi:hypothetical protein CBR59_24405 [Bacillus thuringiensis]|uniref:hypothetical protein n=1 Tax=Bacillus thuringiensis TaxID=1428 RepID=UPI000C9EBA91|nr:hypothetical protein [Bacillus thuringiensis]PNK24685.1 hypothetical protein CBP87_25740 [Bacillus thuringiensis]PNK52023.1 hypothetical protein CBR59_24405 [Bacillus thuringiensis]
MNIIEYLREETNDFVTIEEYELTDLATSYNIRFLVDNRQLIYDYFDTHKLISLDNEEQYYDFLYLDYILKLEEYINDIPEDFGKPLKELIQYLNEDKEIITNGSIIKCLQSNYEQIFTLANRLSDRGSMKATLELMIKFYSGLKDSGIFQYLIREHTYFAFDNFEKLFDILKKNNQELLKLLMVDNLHKISWIRTINICDVVKILYKRKFADIAKEIGRKVFENIVERYKHMEDEYSLQRDLKVVYDTLYLLRMNEVKELTLIIREIDEKVNKRIMETGQTFKYEFTTEPYRKWMEKNRKAVPFARYLTISHEMSEENLWVSFLIKSSISFKGSILHDIASTSSTNDYFTLSRKSQFDIFIDLHSSKLLYWFSKDELAEEFNNSLKVVISSIFEILNHDIEFENLDNNIDDLINILREVVKNNEHGITLFNKLMYVISFLEKILRLVYVSIDSTVFFEKNITLGAIFGNGNNLNQVMLKVLGEHHLRWTRYYLLKDDNEVGLEYRNRIAHLRDINPSDFIMFEFLKVVWIVFSTINTILINLINNEDLDYLNIENNKEM